MKSIFTIALAVMLCRPAHAGDIVGKISFNGTAPRRTRLLMSGDPACMKDHSGPVLSETVIVNGNGTLQNVFVYVKDGLGNRSFAPPSRTLSLNQKGCVYDPHVLGVQVGQEVEIVNSDATLHNVHSLSHDNPPFNRAEVKKGMRFPVKFEKPEIFKVKCDVHPWMGAYIGVFGNPYFAVTGEAGTFALKGLPPGDYTVETWHELYGTRDLKVHVDAKGTATANFTYGPQ